MRIIELKKREVDYTNYMMRNALDTDYQELIKEDVILTEGGVVKCVYVVHDFNDKDVVDALEAIKYQKNERTAGLKTTSRIIGYAPRNVVRQDYCHAAGLAKDQPREHDAIVNFGKGLAEIYQKHNPELYAKHEKLAEDVLKDYRIQDTPFTSGIINKNNRLKYHFDSGNFDGVASCMAAFKKDVAGGHLALPEYGIALEVANKSVTIFDGQGILHGVTDVKYLHKDGYRYTIVYYSLKGMWKCMTVDEEIARIRNIKTMREKKRAGLSVL